MVPADTRLAAGTHLAVGHILVAGNRPVAGHILVVGCYKDLLAEVVLAEVVLGERTHHTDLADLGLDPD
jgi:hypothetical protein